MDQLIGASPSHTHFSIIGMKYEVPLFSTPYKCSDGPGGILKSDIFAAYVLSLDQIQCNFFESFTTRGYHTVL